MSSTVSYRYVVKSQQVTGPNNEAIPVTYIALVSSAGTIVSVTHLQDYLSQSQAVLNPFSSTASKSAFFFCKMLNNILFEHQKEYRIYNVLNITKPMMERYFLDYANGLDPNGKVRAPETVQKNICVCTYTMAELTRHFGSEMQVTEKELLKSKTTCDYKGNRTTILVPNFTIKGGQIPLPLIREISIDAFQLLLGLAFRYTPEIAFALSIQAFSGAREGEVCNIWQDSSKYGKCIRETMDSSGMILPEINLTCERVLRSDYVNVGKIKKERWQKVYPDFVEAFQKAYAFHKQYMTTQKFEAEYAPMFVNQKGMAMTYEDYRNRFNVLVNNYFIPALKKSSQTDLNLYATLLEERGLGLHCLRHFFTVQLVLRDERPEQIKFWRGDTSIESAMTYWANKGELRRIAKKLHSEFLDTIISYGGKFNEQ